MQENIAATIGTTPYELVIIDNSENKYSIFEAYNLGVKQSQGPYLCFMHDDILYHTDNWGIKLIEHFKDPQTGAIGIAGSPYVVRVAASWWGGGIGNQYLLPAGASPTEPLMISTQQTFIKNEVIVLDGIWICIRKELFNKIGFDASAYKGYHFYDLDICMQVHQSGYKLFNIFDVLISHHSNGNMNSNWCENALIFNRKWKYTLPVSCISLSFSEKCHADLKAMMEFMLTLAANNVARKKMFKLMLSQIIRLKNGFFYYKTPIYIFRYLCIIFRNNTMSTPAAS